MMEKGILSVNVINYNHEIVDISVIREVDNTDIMQHPVFQWLEALVLDCDL